MQHTTLIDRLTANKLVIRISAVLALSLLFSVLAAAVTLASGGREIRIQDKCDKATFPVEAGCIRPGEVSLTDFLAKLNPQDGGHHAWRFSSEALDIKAGEVLRVTNTGGEPHTFSEVMAFGAGIVPPLNAALPDGTAAATPLGPPAFIIAGQRVQVSGLSVGTHKFQCLIHPWMRTVVTVAAQSTTDLGASSDAGASAPLFLPLVVSH